MVRFVAFGRIALSDVTTLRSVAGLSPPSKIRTGMAIESAQADGSGRPEMRSPRTW
jgi:hypothetical protein